MLTYNFQLLERRDVDNEVTIATRMKRQKLQETYPGIDTATLEEIFQANG